MVRSVDRLNAQADPASDTLSLLTPLTRPCGFAGAAPTRIWSI